MTLIHRSVARWPLQLQRHPGLAPTRPQPTMGRSSLTVDLGDVKPALNTGNIKGLLFLDNPREPLFGAAMFSIEYLAGFFDGEGCIDVQRMYAQTAKGKLYVRPRVRLCLANSGRFLLEMLRAQYGGHLADRDPGKRAQQHSTSWEMLSAADMKRFLTPMVPHLVLKREQAKLALWWLDNASGLQAKGPGGVKFDFTPMREAFCDELRQMKVDPQRLSERAVRRITALMRQSDLHGDMETAGETTAALAA